jgi:2-C-methyl-D-erythritol 4-phosphate cytidylyltransferase
MVLAGGVGSRVGANIPKQFIEVQGKPILVHTLEKFQKNHDTDEILVVCIESYREELDGLIERFGLTKVKHVCDGGATYQDSVINGIRALSGICGPDDIVSIHFGASPFVTDDIIADAIRTASKYGNGVSSDPVVLCLAEKDSEDGDRSSIVGRDRDRVMGLNSPQAFRYGLLKDMYEEGFRQDVFKRIDPHTTSLMAALGIRLYFSLGSSMNIKITTADDVKLFEAYLAAGLDNE